MPALSFDANVSLLGEGGSVKMQGGASLNTAQTWFAGSLVWTVAATGRLVKSVSASTAGARFMGICSKRQNTTATDQPVEFFRGGVWVIPMTSTGYTVADMGKFVGFLAAVVGGYTDNPADLVVTALSNGDHVVGMIVGADASSLTIDITLGGLNAATAGLLL